MWAKSSRSNTASSSASRSSVALERAACTRAGLTASSAACRMGSDLGTWDVGLHTDFTCGVGIGAVTLWAQYTGKRRAMSRYFERGPYLHRRWPPKPGLHRPEAMRYYVGDSSTVKFLEIGVHESQRCLWSGWVRSHTHSIPTARHRPLWLRDTRPVLVALHIFAAWISALCASGIHAPNPALHDRLAAGGGARYSRLRHERLQPRCERRRGHRSSGLIPTANHVARCAMPTDPTSCVLDRDFLISEITGDAARAPMALPRPRIAGYRRGQRSCAAGNLRAQSHPAATLRDPAAAWIQLASLRAGGARILPLWAANRISARHIRLAAAATSTYALERQAATARPRF